MTISRGRDSNHQLNCEEKQCQCGKEIDISVIWQMLLSKQAQFYNHQATAAPMEALMDEYNDR